MICPLSEKICAEEECAWWQLNQSGNQCSVSALATSMQNMEASVKGLDTELDIIADHLEKLRRG